MDSSKGPDSLDPGRLMFSEYCVPREIRDQIYSYLLNNSVVYYFPTSDQTRAAKEQNCLSKAYKFYKGRAPAYDFDFTLFTHANEATSKGARAYFNRVNKPILVDYDIPVFAQFIHQYDLSIISDSERLGRSTAHAIHLDLSWPNPPLAEQELLTERDIFDRVEPPEQGKFLMVGTEFHKLVGMLRFMCDCTLRDAAYVTSDQDEALRLQAVKGSGANLSIQVGITRPEILKPQGSKYYTDMLQIITNVDDIVIVSADESDTVATPQYIKSLRRNMSPRLAWLPSQRWDFLDDAKAMKDAADTLALRGDSEAALVRFDQLFQHIQILPNILMDRHFQQWEWASANRSGAKVQKNLLQHDVRLSLVACHLICGDRSMHIRNTLSMGWNLIGNTASISEQLGYCSNEMSLRAHHLDLLGIMALTKERPLSEMRLEILRGISAMSDSGVTSAQASEDIGVLKAHLDALDSGGPDPSMEEITPQLSLFRDGFWIIDSYTKEPVSKRPEGHAHWIDENHLARLDDKDKRAILTLQEENGLPLSEF